jgi:hypothetical protein
MCWKCGEEIKNEKILRTDECPVCKADLHSCRNCIFFEEGAHYDCRETVEENVVQKEKANFCDYFKPQRIFSKSSSAKAEQAKKAFDVLFSK